MTRDDLEFIVNHREAVCADIMLSKGKLYTGDLDRLANFKLAGNILGCEPEYSLINMMMKHVCRLAKMVKELNDHNRHEGQDAWAEVFTDLHNYLYLIEALLTERYGWDHAEGGN